MRIRSRVLRRAGGAVTIGLSVLVIAALSVWSLSDPGHSETAPGSTPATSTSTAVAGYWLVGADGGVFNFGDAKFDGSAGSLHLSAPIVGMAATPDGSGYWLVASDGGVFTYGDAVFHGSAASLHLSAPIVGMAATPDGSGYWLVASDGGVFTYGDAVFHGSTGGLRLNKPVVGMAATSDGAGYWLVASDGGVFTYGDAAFHGSTGSLHLNAPIVAITATSGGGYWLVAVRWRGVHLRRRRVLWLGSGSAPQQAGRGHGRHAGWLLARGVRRWGLQLRGRALRGLDSRHAPQRAGGGCHKRVRHLRWLGRIEGTRGLRRRRGDQWAPPLRRGHR